MKLRDIANEIRKHTELRDIATKYEFLTKLRKLNQSLSYIRIISYFVAQWSYFAASAILIFAFLFLILPNIKTGPANELDAFAKCIAAKDIVMYGADWCSHCQNEKRAFGSSFRFVPYVECPDEPQKCLALGIRYYPTWIFADGKKLEGEQGLEKLAKESGCQLPQ